MRSVFYRLYYGAKEIGLKKILSKLISILTVALFLVVAIAFYLSLPMLIIGTMKREGINAFLLCISTFVFGLWTLIWLIGIRKIVSA